MPKPTRATLIFALLLLAAFAPLAGRARAASQTPDCPALIQAALQDPLLLERLVDPALTSQTEIDALIAQVAPLNLCLSQRPYGELSPQEQELYLLSEYFMVFSGGKGTPAGQDAYRQIDLASSDDSAVRLLREQIGLPPPPGYVFYLSYPSLAAMPEILQAIFADPDIAGVTVFTRYVAVFDNQELDSFNRLLLEQALPATISHELVHAYINASLGAERLQAMPRWFDEGLATYLSGSEVEHSVVTPSATLRRGTSAEYEQFNLIFDYLESRLGRPALLKAIRQAVLQADAAQLYRPLKIEDDAALLALAQQWQAGRVRTRLIWLAGVLVLGMALALGGWGALRRRAALAAPTCQVCERRFWPWRAAHLQQYEPRRRVWAQQKTGRSFAHPRLIYVRCICDDCLEHSRALGASAQVELSELRAALRPRYAAWLVQTPPGGLPQVLEVGLDVEVQALRVDPAWLADRITLAGAGLQRQALPFEQALDLLLQAALTSSPRYRGWLEQPAPFEFACCERFDPLTELPPAYFKALQKTVFVDEQHTVLLMGSLFRRPDGDIDLFWAPPAPADD
jgi:hypothetical protein